MPFVDLPLCLRPNISADSHRGVSDPVASCKPPFQMAERHGPPTTECCQDWLRSQLWKSRLREDVIQFLRS
jgi:hypothetical protein